MFTNPLIETPSEEAAVLLDRALQELGLLTSFGIGRFRQFGKSLKEERADLANRLEEIAACADWVKLQAPIKTVNRRHTSYGYKHAVERWFEGRCSGIYISNGAFIAAAVGLGHEARVTRGNPNVCFRFSERALKQTPGF